MAPGGEQLALHGPVAGQRLQAFHAPGNEAAGDVERQVGPLECTSAREADSGTHGGGGAGKILKKIQACLSIRRQGVRRS